MTASSRPWHGAHDRHHAANQDMLLCTLAGPDAAAAQHAFRALYQALWRKLRRAAVRIGVTYDIPEAICEETAHDVLAALWIGRKEPRRGPVFPLLHTIVLRRLMNERRNAEREDRHLHEHYARCGFTQAYDEEMRPLWSGPFADERALRMEIRESVGRSLNRMPLARRCVVADQFLDELAVMESAERRAYSVNTVKSYRRVGGRQLSAHVRADGHALSS